MQLIPGGEDASKFPSTISSSHSTSGRGQCPLDAGGPDGQLPGISEAYDAAASGDRVATCTTTHVRQPLQDRQGD